MTAPQIARFLYFSNLFILLLVAVVPIIFFILVHILEGRSLNLEALSYLGIFYLVSLIPTIIGTALLWGYAKLAKQEPFAVQNRTFWLISGTINLLWTLFVLGSGFYSGTAFANLLQPATFVALWSIFVGGCSFYAAYITP